jgi:hypothetical protein
VATTPACTRAMASATMSRWAAATAPRNGRLRLRRLLPVRARRRVLRRCAGRHGLLQRRHRLHGLFVGAEWLPGGLRGLLVKHRVSLGRRVPILVGDPRRDGTTLSAACSPACRHAARGCEVVRVLRRREWPANAGPSAHRRAALRRQLCRACRQRAGAARVRRQPGGAFVRVRLVVARSPRSLQYAGQPCHARGGCPGRDGRVRRNICSGHRA